MYQPYPSGDPGPMQPAPPPPPSILNAIKFMYAGAGLSAIEFIIALTTISSLKNVIQAKDPSLTASQVNAATTIALVGVGFFGLLGVALWLWMAWANKSGRNWARIVATVLFGLNSLGLISLAQPHTVIGTLMTLLVWIAGLGAIIFLWNQQSSAFFQARSTKSR
jgi:hypothetical protein